MTRDPGTCYQQPFTDLERAWSKLDQTRGEDFFVATRGNWRSWVSTLVFWPLYLHSMSCRAMGWA